MPNPCSARGYPCSQRCEGVNGSSLLGWVHTVVQLQCQYLAAASTASCVTDAGGFEQNWFLNAGTRLHSRIVASFSVPFLTMHARFDSHLI